MIGFIAIGSIAVSGCAKKSDDKAASSGSDSTGTTGSSNGAGSSGSNAGSSGSNDGQGGGPGGLANNPSADQQKLVERGGYLAGLMGCGFCHMPMGPNGPDFARAFAGGLEVPEVFGTWRSPNITPHKGSGIGNWSDDQIIAAVREGVRPDGSQLYPIMPYLNYNRMTDADAKSLVAFLRSVPAIDNVVAPTKDLKLPKIPAPKAANVADPVDDSAKHGEYLVTLMHCNMCHTPIGKDGAPDMSKMFAGGFEMELPMLGSGKLYGANLTSDPETGLGTWSVEDIAKAVKTMTRPDGTIIQGPMQFYLAGWSKLEDKDLTAIATYVKAIPAIKNKVAKSTFKPNSGPPADAGNAGLPADAAKTNSAAGSANADVDGKASAGKASAAEGEGAIGTGRSRGGAPGGTKPADAMKPPAPAGAKAVAPKKPATRGPVKKQEDPDAGGE